MRERVAELAALVDRPGSLGRDVRGDAPGERGLADKPAQSFAILRHMRVALAVGAFEIRVRDKTWTAVSGAGDVDRRQIALEDGPVEMRVEQIQPGRRPEVAEQTWLHMLGRERLLEQRVVEEVDLPDREVVRSPPIGVEQCVVGQARSHEKASSAIRGGPPSSSPHSAARCQRAGSAKSGSSAAAPRADSKTK